MMSNAFGIDPYTSVTIVDAAAGIVRYDPPRTKVGIIGAGFGRNNAPWSDPAWVLFGLNQIAQKRATTWFELHPRAVQSERDLAFLRACPTPCYVLDLEEWDGLIPAAVQFPLDRLRAAGFREYFTCTFAYQCALAILDGFEEIGLWGVSLHLGTPRERLLERACVDYWIGFAEGRGITVSEDSGCARRPYLYGYDYEDEKLEGDKAVARFVQVAQQMGYLDLSQVDP